MKTIFIIIGGMTDISLSGGTIIDAAMPSLKTLAANGTTGYYRPVSFGVELNELNSLFSLFGYDPRKGMPGEDELFRIGNEKELKDSSLPGIILPGFSQNGIMISSSPIARGIGKLAMLETPSLSADADDFENAASEITAIALNNISSKELVAIYTDWPALASFNGDSIAKRELLQIIDSEIISPLADYVWRTGEVMNMAVCSAFTVSSRKRDYADTDLPALIYFNDLLNPEESEFENKTPQQRLYLPNPYSLMERLVYPCEQF